MTDTTTLDQLDQIPGLAAEVYITAGCKNPSGQAPTRTRDRGAPPAPADLGALDALRRGPHGLLHELVECTRAVGEMLAAQGRDWPDIVDPPRWAAECAWLTATAPDWQADGFCRDYITRHVRHVYAALAAEARLPRPSRLACPTCGGRLAESAGGWLTCTECARQYEGKSRIVAWFMRRPPMTTPEICQLFDITAERLRQWHHRGIIAPADPAARPATWRPLDVLTILRPDLAGQLTEREPALASEAS